MDLRNSCPLLGFGFVSLRKMAHPARFCGNSSGGCFHRRAVVESRSTSHAHTGETRLWFGLLLPASGLLIHRFVPWKWPLVVSTAMALLFLGITLAKPETHDRTLMPALQSPWFVPHVVIYMMAYAFLCYTALTSICYTWISRNNPGRAESALPIVEASLWVGFGLLTLGLLCGAVWAKEAWGHYWTWDPKETWAFLTWGCYLLYFHLQPVWRKNPRSALFFLALASVTVFLCWFAVNAMPSAAQSVHTYTG